MLNASQFSSLLPSRSILPNDGAASHGITIGHHRHPPATIDVPGLESVLLVIHLGGPVAVEERSGPGWVRRWAHKGDVTLTPPGDAATRRFDARLEVLVVQIEAWLMSEVLEELETTGQSSPTLTPQFAEADQILASYCQLYLLEAQQPMDAGQVLARETLARAIAICVLRRYSITNPVRVPPRLAMAPGRLRRVVDHMRGHVAGNPTLAELAQLSGLSPTHFARAFRKATGVPPHRYLVEVKMEAARELLASSDLPIAAVAAKCGFSFASSFATAFHKSVGATPQAWRLDHRTVVAACSS